MADRLCMGCMEVVVKSGFNSPNFPHIKTVSNVLFETVFGTPDWIRTSGL